jgi:hypothetical protein
VIETEERSSGPQQPAAAAFLNARQLAPSPNEAQQDLMFSSMK